MPAVSGEASALNWLMAWLGEQNVETEIPETSSEAAPPLPTPSKVHWMSLSPALVSFEAPVLTAEAQSGEEPAVPAVSVETPEPAVPAVEVVIDGHDETDEDKDLPSSVHAEPLSMPPSASSPVAPVATSISVPVPVPVDNDLPALPAAEAPSLRAVRSESPIADAAPEPSAPARLPGVNGMTQRPAARADDKGEVIWSAKFAVKEEQAVMTGVGDAVPAVRPQPEVTVRPVIAAESEAPAKPAVTGVQAFQPGESPRQQLDSENSEAGGEEPEKKQAIDFPRERLSRKDTQDSKQESASSGGEHPESKLTESGARPSHFSAEFVSRAAAPSRVSDAAPVESPALEPAAPLKPTQIATLQVDVPAPAGSDDMTPMRLVVSQRGDQVNVRLRSFDSAVAPIDDTRMQPLLHSLAEKGFVAELKPGARLDESMPMMVERTQEKQMVMAEPSGSQNDAQSFQNANERQQQNQERQQQQQAFFLRKQLKSVQSEAFMLPVAAETNKGTFQQGASR